MEKNFKNNLNLLIGSLAPGAWARKHNLPVRQIERYAKGDQEPSLEKLLQISKVAGVSVGWLAAGEESKKLQKNGEIAATISPGDEITKAKIAHQQNKPTNKAVYLKQIVEWMDETFGEGSEEQGLFFYDDLKSRYESFEQFLEKKRPSQNTATGSTHKPHRKTGT